MKPKPFEKIDITLLNDYVNSSYIVIDGLCFDSANDWDDNGINCPKQKEIHNTLITLERILKDYRDGKLRYE